ncbi:MAG TPA: cytochrome c [Candidatus Bathyarchaeia archaeon]|nr:cytochrome c [Candidatus Bathyarchaeia archaeon]
MRPVVVAVAALLTAALAGSTAAQDKQITLPPDHEYGRLQDGPGQDTAQTQCQSCHSTDYIVRQPPGEARQWEAVVTKMIKVFGAPISETDTRAITDYLARTYGRPR